jgi:hypothetical protein
MKSRKRHSNLPIRAIPSSNPSPPPSARTITIPSTNTTPQSSAYPSAYPPEDEEEVVRKVKPFKFLELPSELRNKIYEFHFLDAPLIIDLDPDNYKSIHRKFSLFLVSKQIHDEASHYFYSTRTIRLFPTHGRWFFKSKKPLLARLPPRYRESITSFQLRLGPGFNNPPQGWVVNDALGLRDATDARVLHVYVEVDTSDPIFKGFRRAEDGFYENFSRNLQNQVLSSLPSIVEVQFDGYRSVQKNGNMMRGLIENATKHKKLISWGPERRWGEEDEGKWADDILMKENTTVPIACAEITVVS